MTLFHLLMLIDIVSGRVAADGSEQQAKPTFPACPIIPSSGFPLDCADLFRAGYTKSGEAKVWPRNRAIEYAPFPVYCDMETDGGGWTVLQRRGNFSSPTDYFYRNWKDYKEGFGNLEEDFWLGNDYIFALTNQKLYSVRFDLKDAEGEERYAQYDNFWIDGEENNYTLHINYYKGNAGDSMTGHDGQKFSTKEVDNDVSEHNCAESWKGAWWYKSCFDSSLNGPNIRGKFVVGESGIVWFHWRGLRESLAETEIKIRPKNFMKNIIGKFPRLCANTELWDFVA